MPGAGFVTTAGGAGGLWGELLVVLDGTLDGDGARSEQLLSKVVKAKALPVSTANAGILIYVQLPFSVTFASGDSV